MGRSGFRSASTVTSNFHSICMNTDEYPKSAHSMHVQDGFLIKW